MKIVKGKILIIIMACLLGLCTLGILSATTRSMPKTKVQNNEVSNLNNSSLQASNFSELNFTLINGGTEYKVGIADKSAVEVIIPSEYNGLPVTEIADNGFMACAALEKVFIPSSVKRVGNNAFMLSRNLKRVVGMAGVTSIGNSAFNMCTSLENLKLPEGITSLGTSVVKSIPNPIYARATQDKMVALNPDWNYDGNIIYGNTIAFSDYTNVNGEQGYQIDPWQLLSPSSEDLTIYSWCYADEIDTTGKPLLNIGEGAFAMFEVPSITLKHPDGSNLNHAINVESFAFSGVDADYVDIETDITINSGGLQSTSLFWDSKVRSITLPDTLIEIPNLTFSQCINLEEIKNTNTEIETNHLSTKTLKIGIEAFDQCYSLPNLYIHKDIEYIGDNAFKRWGTNPNSSFPMQNIYIDTVESGANWGTLWNKDYNNLRCNIEFTGATEYTVEFIVEQNGVIEPKGNDTKVIQPKSKLEDIVNITTPSSISHDFSGAWYTTIERTPGTEFASDKEINRNITLYAGWEIKHFTRTFENNKFLNFYNAQNGELLTGKTLNFDYDHTFQFYILLNNGYKNVSIHHDNLTLLPNTGDIYTLTIKNQSEIKVNADLITYSIYYANLRNGINPESNPTSFTVESPTITLAAPEWEAYNGKAWDLPILPQGSWGDKTIKAIWTNPVIYSINYLNLRGGNNSAANPMTYTVESPTITFSSPKWDAYYTSRWDINSIPSGSWGIKEIKAIWENPKEYKINYVNVKDGINPTSNPNSFTIESPTINLINPKWIAYEKGIWDKNIIPSGTWGDIEIKAIWYSPCNFTINYNTLGGTNPISNPHTYTYEDPTIILLPPEWAAYKNGSWNITSIPQGSSGDINVIAKWSNPVEFTITYNNLQKGTNPSSNPKTYNVETPSITFAAPEWIAYHNKSWDIIGIPQGSWGNKKIVAQWSDPVEFTIHYNLIGNAQNPSSNRRTYNIETPTFRISEPLGSPRIGYKYRWKSNSFPIYQGSFGDEYYYAEEAPIEYRVDLEYAYVGSPSAITSDSLAISGFNAKYDKTYTVYKILGVNNSKYYIVYRRESDNNPDQWIGLTNSNTGTFSNLTSLDGDTVYFYLTEKNCISEGSMITLSDGSQKAVEDLTGDEQLLVWNLFTGKFDTAPILFIDKDAKSSYEITHLYFSDGTEVKVIYEHAFWNIDLNEYVFLRNDAAKYIGHRFNKQILDENGDMSWTAVELIDVKVYNEVTTSWSPVTYSHLCYYVNGMLTMPGATEGLINIFEVDADTMKINEAAYQADLEKYGLLTYEEVAHIMPEAVFDAFNGQYLKISIGKGLITWDEILSLLDRYAKYF